jgi:hypothetical protein
MWIDEIIGTRAGDYVRGNPLLVEDVRTRMLAGSAAIRTSPPPQPVESWAVSERFRGIEHAGLVVVNMRDETDRVAAELLVADVQRLRKADALFGDILGWCGHRTPITAVVANIADPSDSGRQKALTRVAECFGCRAETLGGISIRLQPPGRLTFNPFARLAAADVHCRNRFAETSKASSGGPKNSPDGKIESSYLSLL